MQVHLDFGVIVQLFGLVQGLSTSLYLLLARPARPGARWLGLGLLALTLQVLDYFLSRTGIYYRHRELYFLPLFFSWSFGPLLLSYGRAFYAAADGRANPALRWPHWLPVLLQAGFYLLVSAQSFDTKTWFWLSVHKPVTRYVEHYGAVLSLLAYLGATYRLTRQHGHRPRWLRRGLVALATFYIAAALDPLLNSWYLPAGAPKFYLTSLVLPALAYALALAGWRQGRAIATPGSVPTPASPLGAASGAGSSPVATAAAPPAPPAVDPAQLARMVTALAGEQLYKNPDLTLDALARHLGLTPNAASQLLNAGLGLSFSDAVNGYRLEEVKRRLRAGDARRLTVLALALEAGFNSKTTFNRVFKEKTGLTPKDYQKKSQPTHWDDSVPAPG